MLAQCWASIVEYLVFGMNMKLSNILLTQFSLYVHKGGLKPHSFINLPNKRKALIQCWTMLGHILQRWPNIDPALRQCFVFAG